MKGRGNLLLTLALRDCREEWPSALCMLLSIAAVLVPVLILVSIRAGVIDQMRAELDRSPQSRELLTIGEPSIGSDLIENLRADRTAVFVAPRTRLLSAAAVLRTPDFVNATEVDMVPSGPGDPMVRGNWQRNTIAISETAERALNVGRGGKVLLVLERINAEGKSQSQRLTMQVIDVVSHERSRSSQAQAFVLSDLIEATEVWRENPAVPDLANAAARASAAANSRRYTGLRIFARDIDAVDGLRAKLSAEGIDTQSRAADIRIVQRLSQSMSIFIGALAVFMTGGLVLALGAIQWGWVERKRYDYAYLRLLGLGRRELGLLPVIQAILLAIPAAIMAVGITALAQILINRLFAGQLGGLGTVSRMPLGLSALLVAAVFVVAALGAFFAARNAARVSPIVALRGN